MIKDTKISLEEVVKAEKIVRPFIRQTPLVHYASLSNLVGANIYVKHENHNPGGSFKIRGGINIMHHIKKNNVNGVTTFSTGNHGISVAMAAKMYGVKAVVVVPEGNNPDKNQTIIDLGAELIEAGNSFEEAANFVGKISKERGLYFIHAANEPQLINGVGTEFLEIFNELPDIDVIILPIGGGSELAAAVTVLKRLKPEVKIIAVQAEKSQAAFLSWKHQKITRSTNETFAGGFATGSAFEIPFSIYKDQLEEFILLSESEIEEGIVLALKYTKNLAEGSGGAPLSAALKLKSLLKNKNVVLQMSGCNISMETLQDIMK